MKMNQEELIKYIQEHFNYTPSNANYFQTYDEVIIELYNSIKSNHYYCVFSKFITDDFRKQLRNDFGQPIEFEYGNRTVQKMKIRLRK